MRPARRLNHPAALVEGVEPGIGIGLQDAAKIAQAPLRVLACVFQRCRPGIPTLIRAPF